MILNYLRYRMKQNYQTNLIVQKYLLYLLNQMYLRYQN